MQNIYTQIYRIIYSVLHLREIKNYTNYQAKRDTIFQLLTKTFPYDM